MDDLLTQVAKNQQKTNDEIGFLSNITPVFKIRRRGIRLVHSPIVVTNTDIGDAFILGSATNGVLGAHNGHAGTQVTLGRGKIGPTLTLAVTNANNTYQEMLRANTFVNTGATTATVSTVNHDINFTAGQVYKSNPIFNNGQTIVKATLNILASNITNVANLRFYLSADNGVTLEQVTNAVEHTFTVTGNKLVLYMLCTAATAAVDIEDTNGKSTPIEVSYVIA